MPPREPVAARPHEIADEWRPRAYPKLARQKRRAIRKVFLMGVFQPDAMHYAIWGRNERLGPIGKAHEDPVAALALLVEACERREPPDKLAPYLDAAHSALRHIAPERDATGRRTSAGADRQVGRRSVGA